MELGGVRIPRLGGIRRQDLQVVVAAEGDQGVLRAASRMGAAEDGPHAGPALQLVDPLLEIADAEQDVIDLRQAGGGVRHGGNLSRAGPAPAQARPEERETAVRVRRTARSIGAWRHLSAAAP